MSGAGLPSADALLGPDASPPSSAAPEVPIPQEWQADAKAEASARKQGKETPQSAYERFLNKTKVGRILDAFGTGWKDEWGGAPLGLSPETTKAMNKAGFDPSRIPLPLGMFGIENLAQAASVLDSAQRTIGSVTTGAPEAIGQTAEETGLAQAYGHSGHDLAHDLVGLATTVGVVSGTGVRGPAVKSFEELAAEKGAVRGVEGLPPEGPSASTGAAPAASAAPLPAPPPPLPDTRGQGVQYHGATSPISKLNEGYYNDKNIYGAYGFYTTDALDIAKGYQRKSPTGTFYKATEKTPVKMFDMEEPKPQSEWTNILGSRGPSDDIVGEAVDIASNDNGGKANLRQIMDEMRGLSSEYGYSRDTVQEYFDGIQNQLEQLGFGGMRHLGGLQSKKPPHNVQIYFRPHEQLDLEHYTPAPPEPVRYAASDEGLKPAELSMPVPQGDTTPAPLVDKAGNVNLDRIGAPEDVKDVIRLSAAANNEFIGARRGVVSLADTEEMSQALGMTPEQLAKRNIGQAFNAEEITAARNLLVQSATSVKDLASKAAVGSDEDMLAFQQAATRHVAIQEQVAGLTAEAGRALSAFRITAGDAEYANNLRKVIDASGGIDRIRDVADAINRLDTPQQVSRYLLDARKAKTSDMLIEAWINGLLSGPRSHVTNVLSNTLTAINSVPESFGAAIVGRVRTAIGIGGPERTAFGEAKARMFGLVQGAPEGVKAAYRAFRDELPSGGTAKIEQRRFQAIPSVKIGGAEIGGKQIRIPSRLLMAEDELFKAVARRSELNAQAVRIASNEGLSGNTLANRIADLLENPTQAMHDAAQDFADYQTFQNELGKAGKSVQQFANTHPLLKLLIPFVRTPVNILKYAGERTPLSLFSKEVRKTIAGVYGDIPRDEQISRLTLGSLISVSALGLAAKGHITGGGPTDPKQRALLYASGWQPYSLRIGDTWISYSRMDPFATMLGVSADAYDIAQHMTDPDAGDVAALILASVSKNLVNKTYLQGISQAIEAVQDPDRYGKQYIQQFAGSIVPTGVAQFAQTQDPIMRQTRGILDTIKSRVPGLSESLLPRRDIWGEPIQRQGSLGPDIISPFFEQRLKHDRTTNELLDLGIYPAPPARKLNGIQLTDQQYDDFSRISGRLLKMQLDISTSQPGFDLLTPYIKAELINTAIDRSRRAATAYIKMQHQEILRDATQNRIDQITGKKPPPGAHKLPSHSTVSELLGPETIH